MKPKPTEGKGIKREDLIARIIFMEQIEFDKGGEEAVMKFRKDNPNFYKVFDHPSHH